MSPWQESGCEVCRKQWETGHHPYQIATNIGRHAHLHHCDVCGIYWEQNQRWAEPISEEKAREFYPDAFDRDIDVTYFIPLNALESALESARGGRSSLSEFFCAFAESDIVVPSGSELMSDGSGFQPLLFDKKGVQMVACFTAMERIGEFSRLTPYCLTIKGSEFLLRIPPEYGLVVNPGQPAGFDVPPSGLRAIIAEIAG